MLTGRRSRVTDGIVRGNKMRQRTLGNVRRWFSSALQRWIHLLHLSHLRLLQRQERRSSSFKAGDFVLRFCLYATLICCFHPVRTE